MSRIQAFDYSVNLLKFIFWQYDDPSDENIAKLVADKQTALTALQETFWTDWYDDVFNLDTAQDFGISVWSFILNLPLIDIDGDNPDAPFGFNALDENFFNGAFVVADTGVSLLTIEQKRILLKMRYNKLTTRGTPPEANILFQNVFGTLGLVFMQDNLDMTVEYVFDFAIPDWITFIFDNFDVFPTPQCVSATLTGP